MEIAIDKDGNSIKVYVEGISWESLIEMFRPEMVAVYRLVFYTEERCVYTDYTLPMTDDGKMNFYKQVIRMDHLIDKLKNDFYLYEPCEALIGNNRFHLRRMFLDAYVLTFWDKKVADLFLNKLTKHYYSGMFKALQEGTPYSTAALDEDFTLGPTFDRFLHYRFEKWHAEIVTEYEKSLIREQ